ncbi:MULTISPECIES: hypothetical protein [Mesorhizobium]|uniref:hypothetical protein n=1 Tax=Mesorhizobium TaxID=68287 RepID=UPI001FE4D7EC|nr:MULTISPECIES: hypothetical protein [Mesorhizobium]
MLVKHVDDQWIVRIVEDGKATVQVFKTQVHAENFAHSHRNRLGLPGEPPIQPTSSQE